MDIRELKARAKALTRGEDVDPLSYRERAFLIANDAYALANFMVGNNPGKVNAVLRSQGYTHLKFVPDPTALLRQLEILIERGDTATFAEVLKNFDLITDDLDPEYVSELRKITFQ